MLPSNRVTHCLSQLYNNNLASPLHAYQTIPEIDKSASNSENHLQSEGVKPKVFNPEFMRSANNQTFTQEIQQITDKSTFVPRLDNIVIAISSGALFDFTHDHIIGQTQGQDAYTAYQRANETSILDKGQAFSLVEKLYAINQKLVDIGSSARFDVVITSKNTPDAAVRASHSINHYQLPISRIAFSSGASPFKYAKAFGATLYLTTNPNDAKEALAARVPAAHILPSKQGSTHCDQLRVAFDADAVIFSDAMERISMTQGLSAFYSHEQQNAHKPLDKGPLFPLLHQLTLLKKEFPKNQAPIRIAITTARGAPADERLLRTLRSWDIEVDELHLLGGKDKGPFLEAFEADLFFDDKFKNAENGSQYVVSGHVNHGVSNE